MLKTHSYLLIIAFITLPAILQAQITIDKADMPTAGKYYYITSSPLQPFADITSSGANHSWDFSMMVDVSQRTDTFISMNNTPSVYKLLFNNNYDLSHKATVAQPQKTFNLMDSLPVKDFYSFFKTSSTDFSLVGYGVSISGMQVPLRFDAIDYIYRLPIKYGNSDSCTSRFAMGLEGMGYIGQVKKRKNIVDGWGTLKTPYGTFSVLRIKSEIQEKDTFYLDTIGIKFPAVYRNYTEYKWLANGFSVPVLTITTDSMSARAEFIDSLFTTNLNNTEIVNQGNSVTIYTSGNILHINYASALPQDTEIGIYDILGRQKAVLRTLLSSASTCKLNLKDLNISSGINILRIKYDKHSFSKKISFL